MTVEQIMKLPYILFVVGMLDAPSIDFDNKKEKEKVNTPKSADEEIAAITGALN